MRYFWLLLTAALVCFIFYNSSLPARESGQLSGWAAALVTELARLLQLETEGDVEHSIRKLAHFCEFALLGWCMCRTFASFHVSNRASNGYILFLCLLVAAVDEYIQLFSPGRSSRVTDVLLDFSGVFCMWLGYRIWQWSGWR